MTASILKAIAVAISLSLLSGCGTPQIATEQVNARLDNFRKGTVELNCGSGRCSFRFGTKRAEAKNYHNEELWLDLASLMLSIDYNDDLAWYYLARSAEGLGHYKAADRYYRKARAALINCSFMFNTCDGIDIDRETSHRLQALKNKRVGPAITQLTKKDAQLKPKDDRVSSKVDKHRFQVGLAPQKSAPNQCDRFEIVHSLEGNDISLQLDTDCPRDAKVYWSVSRSFVDAITNSRKSFLYSFEIGEIADWVTPRKIALDDAIWVKEFEDLKEQKKQQGKPTHISSVDHNVKVSVYVDPQKVQEISGNAVKKTAQGRHQVQRILTVHAPHNLNNLVSDPVTLAALKRQRERQKAKQGEREKFKPPKRRDVRCNPDFKEAYVWAKSLIKEQLKNPRSAKFPWYDEFLYTHTSQCGDVTIQGYVDSKNSYGAVVRTRFIASVKKDDKKTWRLNYFEPY